MIPFFCVAVALVIVPLVLKFHLFPILPYDLNEYRLTKEFFALLLAILCFGWVTFRGRLQPIKNPWLVCLIGYLALHRFVMPPFELFLFGTNVGAFWIYKPMFVALIFFALFWAIASTEIPFTPLRILFRVVSNVGLICAVYLILQKLGIDPMQKVNSEFVAAAVDSAEAPSTLIHPNYAGAFLALCLPLCLYSRKWFCFFVTAIAIVLSQSAFAVLGGVVGVLSFLWFSCRRWRKIMIWNLGVIVVGAVLIYGLHPFALPDNGRFGAWASIFHDTIYPFMDDKSHAVYGFGLGSYRYLWVPHYHHPFTQAHNEYLEFFFNTGIVGLTLLIFSIFWLLKRAVPLTITDEQVGALLAVLLASLVMATGLFVWQIEPTRIYTVIFAGLITNKILKGVPQ